MLNAPSMDCEDIQRDGGVREDRKNLCVQSGEWGGDMLRERRGKSLRGTLKVIKGRNTSCIASGRHEAWEPCFLNPRYE